MRKTLIILVIFFAGFYFGGTVISAIQSAYKVVAEEVHNANR